mgnify:CR=1 FL=1
MYKFKNTTLYKSFRILLCISLLQGYFTISVAQVAAEREGTTINSSLDSSKNASNTSPEELSTKPDSAPSIDETNLTNYLSSEETELLGTYIDTTSPTQFLAGLIQATGDGQTQVRTTALGVIRKVLTANPTWANPNSLVLVTEIFSSSDKYTEATSVFDLLTLFTEVNSDISNEVLTLAFKMLSLHANDKEHTPSESITSLFRNLAATSPDCIKDILVIAQADADDRNRNEQVRVEILRILNSLCDLETINADPTYIDKLFSIVLQDAQDSSTYVTNEVIPVLTNITNTNPEYAQKAFAAVIRSTKSEDYATRSSGLSTLKFFVKADTAYAQEVFDIAIGATKDAQALVRWNAMTVLATVVKAEPKYAQGSLEAALQAANEQDFSVSITALRLLKALVKLDDLYPRQALNVAVKAISHQHQEVRIEALKLLATIVDSDASCAATAFSVGDKSIQQADEQIRWNGLLLLLSVVKAANAEYAQKVFDIAVKATTDKAWFIRQDGLVIIQNIIESNIQYASKALPIVVKLVKDEKDTVRLNALYVLESLLKVNPKLIENIYQIAVTIIKDTTVEVRRQVWSVLQAILKIDAQYVQQKEFRSMIREASLDVDAAIRKTAHDLLITYLLKE